MAKRNSSLRNTPKSRSRAGRTKSSGGAKAIAARKKPARATKSSGGGARSTTRAATGVTRSSGRDRSSLRNRSRETAQSKNKTVRTLEEIADRENLNGEDLYQRTSDYRQQKRMEEDVFAPTLQKANLWLKEVMEEIGTQDRHRAHTALKSVLQTLRDRLTAEEAVDLASQLPTLIRGMFFEGWKPAGKPVKYSKEEFINEVRGHFQNLSGINHAEIIRAVFAVLQRNIDPGEIQHVIGTMPEEFAELWMEKELV
jgi:uncharacterized protein (DUF2267 family)